MTNDASPASAVGAPVVKTIRERVPEFEQAFQEALNDEGPDMGAFQAMSVFAGWLAERIEASPENSVEQQAFAVIEEVASSADYPMGRSLVTEFVGALRDNPRAVALMGPATVRFAR